MVSWLINCEVGGCCYCRLLLGGVALLWLFMVCLLCLIVLGCTAYFIVRLLVTFCIVGYWLFCCLVGCNGV